MNTTLDTLKSAFKGRPILFCELPSDLAYGLANEPHRLARFTHTWYRSETVKTKLPTLVILEARPDPTKYSAEASPSSGCFLALIERSGKVTSFQMRLKFIGAHPLGFDSLEDLIETLVSSEYSADITEGLRASGNFVSMRWIQDTLIDFLWASHRKTLERLTRSLPGALAISEAQRQQEDAMAMARAFFGLRVPKELSDEIHTQEQHAIGQDAATIPGFELIEANLQGQFKFQREDEELIIYNAHQGPIEELLGVDLVYVNETLGSVVMVQYKVLEMSPGTIREKNDWIFRPDEQFYEEVKRMRLPEISRQPDDYRLHRNPYFFKFVRRKQQPSQSDTSLVLSLAHIQNVLADTRHLGPKGGVRFSYDALKGQYLRPSDFIGLVRSGYIGTHRIESDCLRSILKEISGSKRGLVLGHQRKIRQDDGN